MNSRFLYYNYISAFNIPILRLTPSIMQYDISRFHFLPITSNYHLVNGKLKSIYSFKIDFNQEYNIFDQHPATKKYLNILDISYLDFPFKAIHCPQPGNKFDGTLEDSQVQYVIEDIENIKETYNINYHIDAYLTQPNIILSIGKLPIKH